MKNSDYLICFDLDGTLIDSGPINKIYNDLMRDELGVDPVLLEDRLLWSVPVRDRLGIFWKEEVQKKGITQGQIDEMMMTGKSIEAKLKKPLFSHSKSTLELMASSFENLACVSSNFEAEIKEILKKNEILSYFKKITGIDGLSQTKPDPEIYQKTADYFEVTPGKSLTFEDSSNGVLAAKGAGMKVIALATGAQSFEELQKTSADIVLNDLSEVTIEMVVELLGINN